jgi:FAD/FMN-containing dehydrogenase/Fe-S oxidoreductase
VDLRRLQDDLHGFFKGEILFDELSRQLYSTDASIFQVMPAGVVTPRDEEDVCKLVRYAQEHGIALTARGAGTGLAGESLGAGLIVDLSRHFRQILAVGADTVRVEPGVTLSALNTKLAETGRRFAPDSASGNVCTLGGMLATNASGARAVKHGYTRDHVQSLRAVLDNGDAVEVARERLSPFGAAHTHLDDILAALALLLDGNRELIAACKPRTAFNRLGYQLEGVFKDQMLNLPRLLVGAEGTLAFFTQATLATVPLPGGRCLVLVNVASLESAIGTVQEVLASGPSACELLDRRLLSLARGGDSGGAGSLISPAAEAVLLIEFEADTPKEAERLASGLAARLLAEPAVLQTTVASRREEQDPIWQIREAALPSLYGMRAGAQPIAYIEDVAVPVDALHEYMRRAQDILQEHETTASFLVHAGAGQVHTRPFLDLQKPDEVSRLWSIAEEIHALALELGGTVSSQHGTGLARTPWVARQAGPLYPLFRQVKAIFDPKGIFNPGKIVDPDPSQGTRPLRVLAAAPKPASLTLHWQPNEVALEANHCNGCGACRIEAPEQRMCPIFRASHAEEATPRAKANMLRHLLQEKANGLQLSSEEVRTVADLCVHCKRCATECPAHINIPKLMLEAKAANVAEHGMDRTDWFFARLEPVLRWGSALSFLANVTLRSRTGRWLLDRLFGLSAQRRLPRFAARSFMARAKRRGWTNKPTGARPIVLYFVDLYANYMDPQVAEATVAVLHHHGYDVFIPPEQNGSGLEALVHGDVETAREIAQKNLRLLVEAARADWPIICSEPSAAMMLQQDYLDLLAEDDARAVAARTIELTAFLWQLHQQGRLRTDFQPLELAIAHHVPCHLKALHGPVAGPELLKLIPGLQMRTLDVGCSGMAGTFGMKTKNYQTSRLAGAAMLTELKNPRNRFGSSECSSCRMQMEDAARKRTLHPVQYMALAYGLIPKVEERLKAPLLELVLR